jgi:hypothetical protein
MVTSVPGGPVLRLREDRIGAGGVFSAGGELDPQPVKANPATPAVTNAARATAIHVFDLMLIPLSYRPAGQFNYKA